MIIGLVIVILYGWSVRPVEYVNTTPDSLREDYRTDYVLMVAEIYSSEDSLELAVIRLAVLGPENPQMIVAEATDYLSRERLEAFLEKSLNEGREAIKEYLD